MSRRRRCPPDSVETLRSATAVEVEALDQLGRPRSRVGPAQPVAASLADQLVAPALAVSSTVALTDIADPPTYGPGIGHHVVPGHDRTARGWRDQRREHPQRRRLARPVGAEQRDQLAPLDREVDAAHRLDDLLLGREVPGESARPDHRVRHDHHARNTCGQFLSAIGSSLRSMANTSTRMLRLLSLLQTHRYWPGPELADRLEVSSRTVRRDVDRLRELGYPVDATRGIAGGYQLQAGGRCRRSCSKTTRRSRSRLACVPGRAVRSRGSRTRPYGR